MTFTVIYRSKSGGREFLELDVPSKADIWPELKKLGITPISVTPGPAPKRKNASASSASAPSPKTLLYALVAIAALVAVVAFFFLSGGNTATTTKPVSIQKAEAVKPKPKKTEVQKPAVKKDGGLKMPKPSGKRIDKRDEIPAPPPLEELQTKMTNAVPKKKKVAFKNGVEQLIALATPSSPGASVPPLPHLTDEGLAKDLEKAMTHVITADEDDSEATLEKKLTVAEAKEEFRELREKEGFTITEYLNALRDQANLDADFLREAHKMSSELYHDQTVSDEDYLKYRNQINERLKERGLPEIE